MTNISRRAVIYARFSSDLQNPRSAQDQIDLCRAFAESRGWTALEVFADEAISGSKRHRREYNRMLDLIKTGIVDVVLAEGLDRLNRSQELSAHLLSLCEFHDTEIHTLNDGRIEEMHIGMKGTMDAMQLKRIARETHRGLSGNVRDGKSAGGLSFGYRIPFDPTTGARHVGELVINEEEAAIVRRIFAEFAEGKSPTAIAHQLNAEGVPSPRGRGWKVNTIYGNRKRGIGILNNELYVGVRVWNRQQFRKNPETDRRHAQLRDPDAAIRVDVPDLRIVDADLWDRVKARQGEQTRVLKTGAPVALRRKKYLLSGLVRCGDCGGKMTVAGSGARRAYYCANAKAKGAAICKGQPGLRIDKLEPFVLTGLRDDLMTPEAFERFRAGFEARLAEAEQERRQDEAQLRRAIAREQKAIDGCLRAIREDHATPSVYAMLEQSEAAKAKLETELAALESPAPVIRHDLPALYRAHIDAIAETLADPGVVHRASEILSGLIDSITIRHDPELGHNAEIDGRLLGLLGFAEGKNAAAYDAAACSLKVVAGERNHLVLPQKENQCSPWVRGKTILPNYGELRAMKYPKRFDLLFNAYDITDTYLRAKTA